MNASPITNVSYPHFCTGGAKKLKNFLWRVQAFLENFENGTSRDEPKTSLKINFACCTHLMQSALT